MKRMLSVLCLCLLIGPGASGAAQQPASSSEGAATNSVASLQVEEADDGTYIHVSGSRQPTFSVFKLTDPLRLFVDMSASRLAGEQLTKQVGNGVISKVAVVGFTQQSQRVVRVIIGFDQPAHYDVKADGRDVVIFVDGNKRDRRPKNVAKLNEKLDQVKSTYRSKLADSKGRYHRAMGRLERTRQTLDTTRQKLSRLRHRLTEARGDNRQQLEAKIDRQHGLLRRTKAKVNRREHKVADLKAKLDDLVGQRDQAIARARRLDKQRKAAVAEANKARQTTTEARQRADQLASQLGSTRESLEAVASEKDRLQTRLDTMARRAQQSSDKVDAQLAKLEAANKRQRQLEAQLTSLREAVSAGNQSVRAKLEDIEDEKSALSKRLHKQRDQLSQARRQAANANGRVGRLRDQVAERAEEVNQLRAQLEEARQRDARRSPAEHTAADDQEAARRLKQIRAKVDREKTRVARLEQKRTAEHQRLTKLAERRQHAEQQLVDARRRIKARRTELKGIRSRQDLPAARAVAVDPSDSNQVRDIRLETDDGRSRIVVELQRPSDFETRPAKGSRAVMILNDVDLPDTLQRTLAADAQGGAVRFVSSYTDDDGHMHMEAELDGQTSEVVRQEGNKVVWEFAPKVTGRAAQPRQPMAAAESPQRANDGQSFTSAPPNYPRTVTDPTKVNTVPGMKRKRLTIDLRGADIQNVLRLVAKEGGVNIIAGDGVSGSVTMRLREVPLDQAFLTILQSQSLGFEVRGNVIRVAPQEVLNKEQKARAEARARAEKLQPLEVFLLPVNYAQADDMKAQVQSLLSPRGSVTVDGRTNTLIIKDLPDNLESIRALVESLDSQVPQVLIEARIVETNDNFDRQLGIQWGGDFSFSQGNGNPTGLVFPSVLGVAGGATDGDTNTTGTSSNPNFAVNLPAPAGSGAGGAIGLTMGSVGGAVNLNLRLSAMESEGHAKIVSSPRILTLDNTEATISQGTSIPISVVSAAGVQTVFVDATLELTVKPHVTPDGNIQLKIDASKNEPDFQNTGASGDPTIIRKQAETELLIEDGDTTVIGGIYTRNAGSSVSAVPFLYKIPILGNLFKTTSTSERRTEMLIFITPRIVNRAESLGNQSNSGSVDTGQ